MAGLPLTSIRPFAFQERKRFARVQRRVASAVWWCEVGHRVRRWSAV